MTQHIVKSFQEELDSLSAQIAQMGGLTEAQLSAAIEAVTRRDQQLAERARATQPAAPATSRRVRVTGVIE